jgi:hypothetical protein
LIEPYVLQEVEPSVLTLCGIKAGDALKVKKVSKNFLSGEDGDGDMVKYTIM